MKSLSQLLRLIYHPGKRGQMTGLGFYRMQVRGKKSQLAALVVAKET